METRKANGQTSLTPAESPGANELIYKMEIDSQTEKTNLWLPEGVAGGGGEIN